MQRVQVHYSMLTYRFGSCTTNTENLKSKNLSFPRLTKAVTRYQYLSRLDRHEPTEMVSLFHIRCSPSLCNYNPVLRIYSSPLLCRSASSGPVHHQGQGAVQV